MEAILLPKVSEFISNLDITLAGRVLHTIELLETHGSTLRMPYSRALGKKLFELRTVGAMHIRILYFFHAGEAHLIHAIFKKRSALAPKDVAYALQIKKQILASI